jgi:putative radical SAM enzyme (TIGR03279 family)
MKGLSIYFVTPGSIADRMEVEAGDLLLAVNGQTLRDIIDFSYYTASDDQLLLEIEKPGGELWELEIEREQGEPLGLLFSAPEPARCANNCIFCFVHQLPKGLRKPLYVKDEDYRLSFLNGNYVTLANLKNPELQRITEQRLSPLYISVHATNHILRQQLLGNKKIPPIMEQLQRLAAARIVTHTQVVLCPGLNDGAELERTVADLAALYPAVRSLAIVPVGLTRHREKLPILTAIDARYSARFVATWEPKARALRKKIGGAFLMLADEFYLKAGLPFPPIKEYGDFPQIENGVGMVPLFMKEAAQVIKVARPIGKFRATVVTGVSSLGFVGDFLDGLGRKTGLELVPVAVPNRLFGATVTVSGLVSGNDIIVALAGHGACSVLLVPDVMLKEGEGVFLDDLSLAELESRIGSPVVVFDSTPLGCYRALTALSPQNKKSRTVAAL